MKTAVATLLLLVAISSRADEPIKIGVLTFGDYYWVASHHDTSLEEKNGFWFRRVYLTFDKKLSDAFSARLRFEAASPGDFKSSTSVEPFVRDAYVRWNYAPHHRAILGLSPTPMMEFCEEMWAYRHVEKTLPDLQRLGSSRDFGIALAGEFGAVKYHGSVGNGAGTGSETNSGKLARIAFEMRPAENLAVQVYADYDDRPGDDDRNTLQLTGAYHSAVANAGMQWVTQKRDDITIDAASLFAFRRLSKTVTLLGRVDRMFDPNPEGTRIPYLPFDPASKSTLYLAGVDLALHPNFNLIPNVELVDYDDAESDVIPRVTFYFRF